MLNVILFLLAWATPGLASDFPAGTATDVVTGQEVELSTPGEKGLVLAFVSSRCPCSMSHEPVLKALADEFKGFRFIGIHSNQNEVLNETKAHFAAAQLGFPVVQDLGARLADQYGAFKTPHAFVLNREGKIVFQGGVDDSQMAGSARKPYLRRALESVSKGELPAESRVRSLGCIISRKGGGEPNAPAFQGENDCEKHKTN